MVHGESLFLPHIGRVAVATSPICRQKQRRAMYQRSVSMFYTYHIFYHLFSRLFCCYFFIQLLQHASIMLFGSLIFDSAAHWSIYFWLFYQRGEEGTAKTKTNTRHWRITQTYRSLPLWYFPGKGMINHYIPSHFTGRGYKIGAYVITVPSEPFTVLTRNLMEALTLIMSSIWSKVKVVMLENLSDLWRLCRCILSWHLLPSQLLKTGHQQEDGPDHANWDVTSWSHLMT